MLSFIRVLQISVTQALSPDSLVRNLQQGSLGERGGVRLPGCPCKLRVSITVTLACHCVVPIAPTSDKVTTQNHHSRAPLQPSESNPSDDNPPMAEGLESCHLGLSRSRKSTACSAVCMIEALSINPIGTELCLPQRLLNELYHCQCLPPKQLLF